MFPSCIDKFQFKKETKLDINLNTEMENWDTVIWVGDFNYRINA